MRLLVEYKFFEPGFFSTDLPDWGTAALICRRLGPQAQVLVDTGHHAQGTNVEQIVALLLAEGLLGGFHFNNRKYADDDLIVGAIDPFELFRIMREIALAETDPATSATAAAVEFMIDQSHNIEGKVDAMIQSVMNIQTAYAKALLVDEDAVAAAQLTGDVLGAHRLLLEAFETDVRPLLAELRAEPGPRGRPGGGVPRRRARRAPRGRARHRVGTERVRVSVEVRVALFVTCIGDTVFPEAGRATVRVLERLGHEVVFPAEQTCCGQMHVNSGYRGEALGLARRFVEVFGEYDVVVSPSSSCVGNVRELYPQLAREAGDTQLEQAVGSLAPRVFELSELLVDKLGLTDVGASFPAPGRLPPDLPFAPSDPCRRSTVDAAPQRAGARAGALRPRDRVLRLRRHVRDQERRYVDGDAVGQVRRARGERRRRVYRARRLVSLADRRRARTPRLRRSHDAPRRDSGGREE